MIYLAGPCDSDHRTLMVEAATYIRSKHYDVYCPWELKIENAWDYSQEDWAKLVFDADIRALDAAEAVIMISLGRNSTAGTNWENGYAFAKGIPVHVIQITEDTTSLMTYWGCSSFSNVLPHQDTLYSALRVVLDYLHEEFHDPCLTVLT